MLLTIQKKFRPFSVKLDKCVGSCNTINDLSNKVCVPNKTEDLNLSIFNLITGINESKTLTNDTSCECKKHNVCENDYVWNLATCNYEIEKYLASIMDDLTIIFNEVI